MSEMVYGGYIPIIELSKRTTIAVLDELKEKIRGIVPLKDRKRLTFYIIKPRRSFDHPYGEKGYIGWKILSKNQKMPKQRVMIL